MDLQAISGQLYMVEGVVQEHTAPAAASSGYAVPGLLIQTAPPRTARSRQGDLLFVHLTLTGKAEETAVLSQDLLDIISNRFFNSTGGVTSGLRRAMLDANERLLRYNMSGGGPHREGAISCAVLRKGELFMVQAGESVALLGRNFGVEAIPPSKPDHLTPLGRTAGIDIRYTHQQLQTGNTLLLLDPRLAHLSPASFADALVDAEIEYGLQALRGIVDDDSARLILVEFSDEMPADLPATTTGQIAPLPTALPDQQPRREPGAFPPLQMPQAVRETIESVDVERTARLGAAGAARGLSKVTSGMADVLERLRPFSNQSAEDEAEDGGGTAVYSIIALLIPIFVGILVTTAYIQRGIGRDVASIKVEMGQMIALAEEASDERTAREAYSLVLELADQAEAIRPNDTEVDSLRSRSMSALDRIDGITRLSATPFYQYEETTQLTAVSLPSQFTGGVYTLDGANSRVYRHETDDTFLNLAVPDPELLAFEGAVFGNHVVNQVTDIMWRQTGSSVENEGLAMLDAKGALLTYQPSNFAAVNVVPLGLASEWQQPSAITQYRERLYVLDNGARQIWKYFPDGNGFITQENDRVIFFNPNDDPRLQDAVDFDIYSEDGSLIVIYRDGGIRYYDTSSGRIQWNEANLEQSGLTIPFESPTAVKLVGRGLNASIFVADPPTGRIVQISRGGIVLAQYRASDSSGTRVGELFANLTDFAVAEAPLRIFVTNGNILFVATQ